MTNADPMISGLGMQALTAESPGLWAIPWLCLHEFLAIVTHPRIYDPPSTPEQAIDQVDAWLESPGLEMICETGDHWPTLKAPIRGGRVGRLQQRPKKPRIAGLFIQ